MSFMSPTEIAKKREELTTALSSVVQLLNDIPSTEKFTKEDRQNAVEVLARIFPEQLRGPVQSTVDPKLRGGADDEGCLYITAEKKYYELDSAFIRRTLEPHEFIYNIRGELAVPHMIKERLMNDTAAIEFVRENTSIPVPKIFAAFHDNGRYYTVQELIPGVQLAQLVNEADRLVVIKELEEYIEILHNLKSKTMDGVSGLVCLPYRVSIEEKRTDLKFREAEDEEFMFCHGDLNQYNILIDPETLKISAIIDWEYSGFYPKEFEGRFYKRLGYSAAMEDEEDDVPELLEILKNWTI